MTVPHDPKSKALHDVKIYRAVYPCECGAGCDKSGDVNSCWGQVEPVGNVGMLQKHYCQGHMPTYFGLKYKEPK